MAALSDALAGFWGGGESSSSGRHHRNENHENFIGNQLLPQVHRMHKEVRTRRSRAVSKKVQEAILLLKAFAREDWPASSSAAAAGSSGKSRHHHHHHSPKQQQQQQHQQQPPELLPSDYDEEEDSSTVGVSLDGTDATDASSAKSGAEDGRSGGGGGGGRATSSPSPSSAALLSSAAAEDDCISVASDSPRTTTTASMTTDDSYDPQTREPVHEAIVALLDACIMACRQSEHHVSNKGCELALDTIQLVVSERYLSGRAIGSSSSGGGGKQQQQQQQQRREAGGDSSTPVAATSEEPQQQQQDEDESLSLLYRVIQSVSGCCESNSEGIQTSVIRTLRTIITSPKCGVHEAAMLMAFRSTFHVYLVAKSSAGCKQEAKAALQDMLRSVFFRMEAYEAMMSTTTASGGGGGSTNMPSEEGATAGTTTTTATTSVFRSQYHKDSYYLFRSLCKMSSKELPADTGSELENRTSAARLFVAASSSDGADPTSLASKILSLELILSAFDFSGEGFRTGTKFIYLVQHYLCVSLLKNCVSDHARVAFLSQQIFLVLVYKFKGHLKQEIEVFLSNVFVRVLQSPNASFQQKALVLESLRSLCSDPVLLTQIFLNYDCDFHAMNLYKDVVLMLTKLSGKAANAPTLAPTVLSKKDSEQEYELSLAGMEVLVTILKAFLRALGLPGGCEDNDVVASANSATNRIRGMLNLDHATLTTATTARQENETYQQQHAAAATAASATSPPESIAGDSSVDTSNNNTQSAPHHHQQRAGSSSAAVVSAESAHVAGKIVNAFEMKRNAEQNFEIGAVKFTLSLKGGLQFFLDNGFIASCDAQRVALFFLANKDKLDKTQMGEALGREPHASFYKRKKRSPEDGDDGDDGDDGILSADEGGPGFWFRILHHYVEALDFKDLVFDDAIRLFLSGFRLPGEAQKIDRIMEKFAERYTTQNPDVFPSSDTCFILAFSVIMLNTDLHNPSIKPERRMTLESFLRNNRGIGPDGGDLDPEFLSGIFDRIKERPFSLKEDDDARQRAAAAGPQRQQLIDSSAFFEASFFSYSNAQERRRENFQKERDEMMAATQQLMRARPAAAAGGTGATNSGSSGGSNSARLTETVAPSDVVKPMFDVTWGPMLGTLSQVLESSDDDATTAVCLDGFVYAVRIAAHSNMFLIRDAFLSSLAKFTYLGDNSFIKEMKRKNVESIRTLLCIAIEDGEYLGESWGPVLQCISQVSRLRLSASGLDADESFLLRDDADSSAGGGAGGRNKAAAAAATNNIRGDNGNGAANFAEYFRAPSRGSTIAREAAAAEQSNGRAVLEAIQEVLMDKVFSSTVNLSANSLAHFIEQLIAVSASEIAGNSKRGITGVGEPQGPPSRSNSAHGGSATNAGGGGGGGNGSGHGGGADGPSIFSLQRLVEVADYNMEVRGRTVWAQIWSLLGDHFTKLACHDNAMVRMFAIDSLKQLSLKFLEKPELSEFNFQRTFLKPFLVVMEDPGSSEHVRELVLRCADHFIRTKSHNLRSGWKIVFAMLTRSASDPSERVDSLGLSILQRLLDEHLHELCGLADGRGTAAAAAAAAASSDQQHESSLSSLEHHELTSLERRNRNANVDDFVDLCRASLSFVQQDEWANDSPRPIGLSMRAFCHTAIYADLLADQRVLPPVSGAQSSDRYAPGFTYEGLPEDEALEMVLWRPILEGLADGIRSTVRNCVGGVGCLIQRASLLSMRAILLRHGHLFSTSQWVAILEQTLVPAIQAGAEGDLSPVGSITSESPLVSNIDFLVDPLPLPPPPNDVSLLRFEALKTSPNRSLGMAELMLEASFTDLRHRGDGNLRRAYIVAKMAATAARRPTHQQPFPDSWLATTAPVALGLLTDVASEIIIPRGEEGRERLWPIVAGQYKMWCVGRQSSTSTLPGSSWFPCEALVRIACQEVQRLPLRLVDRLPQMSQVEASHWVPLVIHLVIGLLTESVELENAVSRDLLLSKHQALVDRKDKDKESIVERVRKEYIKKEDNHKGRVVDKDVIVNTPFGKGRVVKKRIDRHVNEQGECQTEVTTNIISLDFGGTLFQPVIADPVKLPNQDNVEDREECSDNNMDVLSDKPRTQEDDQQILEGDVPVEVSVVNNAYWEESVPALKVRCIAAHCLHQCLTVLLEKLVMHISMDTATEVLYALDLSRETAEAAVGDEDLATAFQEALLNDWGDGVAVVDEALENAARLSHLHGSSKFFLTQEAGATRSIINFLSLLYKSDERRGSEEEEETLVLGDVDWDREQFAEAQLLSRMKASLDKFLKSEEKDGHLIDPNVWRNASESGGNVAVYCTAFAGVVVDILFIIKTVPSEQFSKHKEDFFRVVCGLIRVHSDEIRKLLQEILSERFGPMLLGVNVD